MPGMSLIILLSLADTKWGTATLPLDVFFYRDTMPRKTPTPGLSILLSHKMNYPAPDTNL